MPISDPGMSAKDIRATWKGYPDLVKAVLQVARQGWKIVKESKHYRAFCPCDQGADFTIPGTPRSDSNASKRVRVNASKCPAQHDLLKARSGRPERPSPAAAQGE